MMEYKDMPEQVKLFVEALKENARQVWNKPDDKDFIDSLIYVGDDEDGMITISDNYERFFESIYTYDPDLDKWYIRGMFSNRPQRNYSFEQAMGDARIMFTG